MLNEVVREWLTATAWLDYRPGWLDPDASVELLDRLRDGLPWEQRAIVLFGREVVPKITC